MSETDTPEWDLAALKGKETADLNVYMPEGYKLVEDGAPWAPLAAGWLRTCLSSGREADQAEAFVTNKLRERAVDMDAASFFWSEVLLPVYNNVKPAIAPAAPATGVLSPATREGLRHVAHDRMKREESVAGSSVRADRFETSDSVHQFGIVPEWKLEVVPLEVPADTLAALKAAAAQCFTHQDERALYPATTDLLSLACGDGYTITREVSYKSKLFKISQTGQPSRVDFAAQQAGCMDDGKAYPVRLLCEEKTCRPSADCLFVSDELGEDTLGFGAARAQAMGQIAGWLEKRGEAEPHPYCYNIVTNLLSTHLVYGDFAPAPTHGERIVRFATCNTSLHLWSGGTEEDALFGFRAFKGYTEDNVAACVGAEGAMAKLAGFIRAACELSQRGRLDLLDGREPLRMPVWLGRLTPDNLAEHNRRHEAYRQDDL